MLYQNGLIRLVPLKTRNAKRILYMNNKLKFYFNQLEQKNKLYDKEFAQQRAQNQLAIINSDEKEITFLSLLNTLPNGKIQTVSSMKYHTQKIKQKLDINFKYHYLHHIYGTRLAELNMPLHILSNQMGHANGRVIEKYYWALSRSGVDILTQNLNRM